MEGLIFDKKPGGAVAEAYRVLCTNLIATLGEKKILEVAGVADTSNTSEVVANLSVALAQAGKNVLVIDCVLRNAKQHELFSLPNRGLAESLSSGEPYINFVKATKQENLFVLAAGVAGENLVETLLSKGMQNLLQDAKETYDVILLDVPPVATVYDAIALGTKADGVLLMLTNKQDKVEQAQKAKEMFTQAGVTVLGCILDKA